MVSEDVDSIDELKSQFILGSTRKPTKSTSVAKKIGTGIVVAPWKLTKIMVYSLEKVLYLSITFIIDRGWPRSNSLLCVQIKIRFKS